MFPSQSPPPGAQFALPPILIANEDATVLLVEKGKRFRRLLGAGLAAGVLILAGSGRPGLSAGGPTDLGVPAGASSAPTIDFDAPETARARVAPRAPTGNPLW